MEFILRLYELFLPFVVLGAYGLGAGIGTYLGFQIGFLVFFSILLCYSVLAELDYLEEKDNERL
jgi:hypothetical protein